MLTHTLRVIFWFVLNVETLRTLYVMASKECGMFRRTRPSRSSVSPRCKSVSRWLTGAASRLRRPRAVSSFTKRGRRWTHFYLLRFPSSTRPTLCLCPHPPQKTNKQKINLNKLRVRSKFKSCSLQPFNTFVVFASMTFLPSRGTAANRWVRYCKSKIL